jgi:hypothetical protein
MDTQQAQVLDVLAYGDASAGLYCSKLLERLGSGGTRRLAKIPKGTRDYMPAQMRIREQVGLLVVFCFLSVPVFMSRR